MAYKLTSWPRSILGILAAHAITLAIFLAIIRCAIAAGVRLSYCANVGPFIDEDDDNFVLYWLAIIVVGACIGLLAANAAIKLLGRKRVDGLPDTAVDAARPH
jgi:hypothetical protein